MAIRPTSAQQIDALVADLHAGDAVARESAHLALATRGSRLALYDLRESLETADARLPVELLAALSAVGDAACLAAIAAAHGRSRDAWWRAHLAEACHAIMKIEKRWPEFWSLVVRLGGETKKAKGKRQEAKGKRQKTKATTTTESRDRT